MEISDKILHHSLANSDWKLSHNMSELSDDIKLAGSRYNFEMCYWEKICHCVMDIYIVIVIYAYEL